MPNVIYIWKSEQWASERNSRNECNMQMEFSESREESNNVFCRRKEKDDLFVLKQTKKFDGKNCYNIHPGTEIT